MALNWYSSKQRATITPKKYGKKCNNGSMYTNEMALTGKLQKK